MEDRKDYSTLVFADSDELVEEIAYDIEQYRDVHDQDVEEFFAYDKKPDHDYSKEDVQAFVEETFRLYDELFGRETPSSTVDDYSSRILDDEDRWDRIKSIEIPSIARSVSAAAVVGFAIGGTVSPVMGALAGCYTGFHVENYFRSNYEEHILPLHAEDGNISTYLAGEIAEHFTGRDMPPGTKPLAFNGLEQALKLEALENQAEKSDNPYWERLYTKEKLDTGLKALAASVPDKDSLLSSMEETGIDSDTTETLTLDISADEDAWIAASILLQARTEDGSLYRDMIEPPLSIRIDVDDRDRLFYRPASTA